MSYLIKYRLSNIIAFASIALIAQMARATPKAPQIKSLESKKIALASLISAAPSKQTYFVYKQVLRGKESYSLTINEGAKLNRTVTLKPELAKTVETDLIALSWSVHPDTHLGVHPGTHPGAHLANASACKVVLGTVAVHSTHDSAQLCAGDRAGALEFERIRENLAKLLQPRSPKA